MGLFGFGKKYTEEDLQNAITSLDTLYRQASGFIATTKTRGQLKQELAVQLHHVLDICRKRKFLRYGNGFMVW